MKEKESKKIQLKEITMKETELRNMKNKYKKVCKEMSLVNFI